jgi:hypothetical protein
MAAYEWTGDARIGQADCFMEKLFRESSSSAIQSSQYGLYHSISFDGACVRDVPEPSNTSSNGKTGWRAYHSYDKLSGNHC